MKALMQQLARDEMCMAKSKRVVKDMRYRYRGRPDGAACLSQLISRHFHVYVSPHIIKDIWADMTDHSVGPSGTRKRKGR